jgi:Leucine-rich repeat (LRR) protein
MSLPPRIGDKPQLNFSLNPPPRTQSRQYGSAENKIRAMPRSPESNMNLWKQRLGHVPDSVCQIGRLKMLRVLDLGHNQLTRLPDEIGGLPNLTDFLYLHDNRLTSLPPPLAAVTRLRYLNLSENAFEVFPECISRISSLLELRMTDNRLHSLPDSIGQLSRLRELHVRNNNLTSLPGSIGELKELRQIDLRGNPLTELPQAIATLPRLKKLDLRWVTTLELPSWTADLEARGCSIYF